MARLCPEKDVGSKNGPGDVRHPGRHHRHQLGFRESFKVRPDDQRRFRLTHEDAGRHFQGFGPAGPHQREHYLARQED